MPITVAEMLTGKGATVWSVPPDCSVWEAVKLMNDLDVGALLVLSDGELVGILSERDCARKLILRKGPAEVTPVRELMTTAVVFVTPDHTTQECMALMTRHHIRHLPVIDTDRLVGVISIRDVVEAILSEQRYTIDQLESYITGGRGA